MNATKLFHRLMFTYFVFVFVCVCVFVCVFVFVFVFVSTTFVFAWLSYKPTMCLSARYQSGTIKCTRTSQSMVNCCSGCFSFPRSLLSMFFVVVLKTATYLNEFWNICWQRNILWYLVQEYRPYKILLAAKISVLL